FEKIYKFMIIKRMLPGTFWWGFETFRRYLALPLIVILGVGQSGFGQIGGEEQEILEVGEVNIIGASHTDPNALKVVSGLKTGNRLNIPDDIQEAFNNLCDLNLFSDIRIVQRERIDNIIFIDIYVEERPRMTRFYLTGNKKS